MESTMKTLNINDIPVANDLDKEEMAAIQGGMRKLPFQINHVGLTLADGEPADVYVDGVRVNSVTDGFAH
jgi:hypothetical protein